MRVKELRGLAKKKLYREGGRFIPRSELGSNGGKKHAE
jgi:hypothetical protein